MEIESIIGELLINKNLTIATAESCTGGMVAARLVNYPGISQCLIEGIVSYSNDSKIRRINVKQDTLNKFGAVSSEVAGEMAMGVAKTSGADIGISTTGIAGPGGGSKEKPVGLVYIGIFYLNKLVTKELRLTGDRQKIRNETVNILLQELLQIIKN